MLNLKLSKHGMQAVKLAFKFESQLHFFLMILTVLHVLFFQLESQGAFIGSFPLKFL